MSQTTMKVIKDTATISGLGYRGKSQVQLKDADPNELQLFIDKMPASIKGKTKSTKCNFQYFFNFAFETKRHIVYRYRQIKLMARVQ